MRFCCTVSITLLWLFCFFGHSQDSGEPEPFNDNSEFIRMVQIPKSPEAAAFEQYGNVPTDLYRGMPNINIPIYTIKGKEMVLPLSLTYDPTNLKVEDIASEVGLGWNLNVGGRITRNVNGLSDDYILGNYSTLTDGSWVLSRYNMVSQGLIHGFNSRADVISHFDFIEDIEDNKVDAAPDTYSLNVNGLSSQLIAQIGKAYSLDDPRMQVSVQRGTKGDIRSWTINKNGTTYIFANSEVTETRTDSGFGDYQGPSHIKYRSSWLLTKIISPNGRDVFDFTYTSGTWPQPKPFSSSSAINRSTYHSINGIMWNGANESWSNVLDHKITQVFLSGISHNGKQIVSISRKTREDHPLNNAIQSIEILDPTSTGPSQEVVQDFYLFHSYFGMPESADPGNYREEDLRLKLDAIGISRLPQSPSLDLENFLKEYNFTYDRPEQVPARDCAGQDAFGYYNGGSCSGSLIPPVSFNGADFTVSGRSFNMEHATKGILKKVRYPTGGTTVFEYEQPIDEYTEIRDRLVNYSLLISDWATMLTITEQGQCNSSGCCPSANGSPVATTFETDVFSVNEDGVYDVTVDMHGTKTPVDNTTQSLRSFIIELPDSQAMSLNEILTECENGTSPFWDFHELYNPVILPFAPQSFPVELKKDKYYQTVLLNNLQDYDNQTIGITMKVSREESYTYVYDTDELPFYRLKTVTDLDANDNVATRREYKYSGITQNQSDRLYYTSHQRKEISEQIVNVPILHRMSKPVMGSEPILTYGEVSERFVDFNDVASNGETIHTFFNVGQNGNVPNTAPPFETRYTNNIEKGKEKTRILYDVAMDTLETWSSSYSPVASGMESLAGLTVKNNWNRQYHTVHVYQRSDGKWLFGYAPWEYSGYQGNTRFGPPDGCDLDGNLDCLDAINPTSTAKPFSISPRTGGMVQQIVSKKLDDQWLTQTTDYEYRDNMLLNSHTVGTSNDEEIKTELYYSSDTEPYSLLPNPSAPELGSNVPDEPILMKVYQNGTLISTSLKDYVQASPVEMGDVPYAASLPDMQQLQAVYTAKGNEPLDNRLLFEKFDTQGNLLQSRDVDANVATTYLWGYNNMYPVAKVENATHAEVIGTGVLQSVLDAPADDDALRTELQKIRDGLPNAMVTTYTYKPLVGITSMTDPKGYTTYYGYDEFNRLSHVIDQDQKVSQRYNYQYKKIYDPLSTGEIVSANTVIAETSNFFDINPTGGSGDLTYHWEIRKGDEVLHTSPQKSFSLAMGYDYYGQVVVTCLVTDQVTGEGKLATKVVEVVHETPFSIGNISHPNRVIADQSNTFTITYAGGSGDFDYHWKIEKGGEPPLTIDDQDNTLTLHLGYEYYGQVKMTCTVIDTATGESLTNDKNVNVEHEHPFTASYFWPLPEYAFTGGTYSFKAFPEGGSGVYTYDWNITKRTTNETIYTTTLQEFSLTMSQEHVGTLDIRCTITDSSTGETLVRDDDLEVSEYFIDVSIDKQSSTHQGGADTVVVKANVTGGVGPYIFQWYKVNDDGSRIAIPGVHDTAQISLTCIFNRHYKVEVVVTDNSDLFTGDDPTAQRSRTFSYSRPDECGSGGGPIE